jgi:hypothetical protein
MGTENLDAHRPTMNVPEGRVQYLVDLGGSREDELY